MRPPCSIFTVFFFYYVRTHAWYASISWQYHPFWIVSSVLTDKRRLVVFRCALRFFTIRKKWIKETVKNKIKCSKTFEMLTVTFGESTMSRIQVQLWCNWFKKCREYVNNDAFLVARARQWPMKTLKQWRKWFLIIIESLLERLLMMLAYRSAHAKQCLRRS